ncbi:hypothetical protein JOF36_005421 [Pseudonocardia parietis]|uniref:Uncharacterized protein n=1 Tax=Pseudonocardia parietis TaxID=570936 RepID=A0ABS4W0J0_9PSEU|nr:hypothetical protein [Pseudonocardia parietis]
MTAHAGTAQAGTVQGALFGDPSLIEAVDDALRLTL